MIQNLASNNVRQESKQAGISLFNALKSAHEESKTIAGAVTQARTLALGKSRDYIGPVELLFIPS